MQISPPGQCSSQLRSSSFLLAFQRVEPLPGEEGALCKKLPVLAAWVLTPHRHYGRRKQRGDPPAAWEWVPGGAVLLQTCARRQGRPREPSRGPQIGRPRLSPEDAELRAGKGETRTCPTGTSCPAAATGEASGRHLSCVLKSLTVPGRGPPPGTALLFKMLLINSRETWAVVHSLPRGLARSVCARPGTEPAGGASVGTRSRQ